jgi:hypothetical protein
VARDPASHLALDPEDRDIFDEPEEEQPTETPEGEEGGEQEAPAAAESRPEWLPENFKSGEDFARSYQELQRKLTEQGNALAQLQQQYAEPEPQYQPEQAPTPPGYGQDDLANAYGEAIEAGDYNRAMQINAYISAQAAQMAMAPYIQQQQQALQPIQQAQSQQNAELAVQLVAREIPDFNEYKDRVGEYIQQRPGLLNALDPSNPYQASEVLKDAYNLVRAQEWQAQQQAQAHQAVTADQAKRAAQTISGSSAPAPGLDPNEAKTEELVRAYRGTSYASGS